MWAALNPSVFRTQSSSSCWAARPVDVASIWSVLIAWWCLILTGTRPMMSKRWLAYGEMARRRPATSTDCSLSVHRHHFCCLISVFYRSVFLANKIAGLERFQIRLRLFADRPGRLRRKSYRGRPIKKPWAAVWWMRNRMWSDISLWENSENSLLSMWRPLVTHMTSKTLILQSIHAADSAESVLTQENI